MLEQPGEPDNKAADAAVHVLAGDVLCEKHGTWSKGTCTWCSAPWLVTALSVVLGAVRRP